MVNCETKLEKTLSKETLHALAVVQSILGRCIGYRPDNVREGWMRIVTSERLFIHDGDKASSDFEHQKVRVDNFSCA